MRLDISKSLLWCFYPCSIPRSWIALKIESPTISIWDFFFWLSFAELILWFLVSLVIWFYWPTILFNCWDLFFYCIYTVIFSESFISRVMPDVILFELWFIEILFVFSSHLLWLMFYKKSILKNFPTFTGKHLCQSLFFNKVY